MRRHDFKGVEWFWLCRRFKDGETAKRGYDRLDQASRDLDGLLDAGCYRHGPENEEPRYVTVVSHRPEGVALAQRVLGGTQFIPDDSIIERLIQRRIDVLGELFEAGAPGGHYPIHHEEGMKL